MTTPQSARELALPATVPSCVTQRPPHEKKASRKQSPVPKKHEDIRITKTCLGPLARLNQCRVQAYGQICCDCCCGVRGPMPISSRPHFMLTSFHRSHAQQETCERSCRWVQRSHLSGFDWCMLGRVLSARPQTHSWASRAFVEGLLLAVPAHLAVARSHPPLPHPRPY